MCSPFWRAALTVIGGVTGSFIVAVGLIFMVLVLIMLTPLHPIFRLFGRKGFYRGNGEVTADMTSFQRR